MCSSMGGEKKWAILLLFQHSRTHTGELIACHFPPLPPSLSVPHSALPNYMISEWEIGGKERLGFLQLVHLFTPGLRANEAVSLHNLFYMLKLKPEFRLQSLL